MANGIYLIVKSKYWLLPINKEDHIGKVAFTGYWDFKHK